MSGIATGAGVGVIRALSAGEYASAFCRFRVQAGHDEGPWVACNWAVGSFMLVGLGTWWVHCLNEQIFARY
jgi:cytochrome c oxidase assembly protein subunit 20